ncbi:MAG: aminopeptidase [Acidobacteriota bacterium]
MEAKIEKNNLEKWADFILDHSLGGITPDDIVMVKGEHITWPLISVLQDKIFKAGGIADVNIVAPDNNRGQVWGASITKHGNIDQINNTPVWHGMRYKTMTKYIEILGSESPDLFAGLPEETSTALSKADLPFRKTRLSKNWVLTLFPTKAFADMEDMTLGEYTEIVVGASVTDPAFLDEVEEPIYKVLNNTKKIRIETEDPGSGRQLELKMDISDRNIIKCTGLRNFPDGEVFTSPDANSVEGEIFVDLPVYYNGVTIQGIYLKFENGIIIDYKANNEFETLRKIIETDDGSKRLGEVALGMNNGLKTALKHPLFVEKVGGTLHIAIGDSYPECYVPKPGSEEGQADLGQFYKEGKANRSAQHVDIVTDFRPGGAGKAVWLDNVRLEVRNNLWAVPGE